MNEWVSGDDTKVLLIQCVSDSKSGFYMHTCLSRQDDIADVLSGRLKMDIRLRPRVPLANTEVK